MPTRSGQNPISLRIPIRRTVRRTDPYAALLFTFGTIACAATQAAQDSTQLFSTGRHAFEQGDYLAAADAFDAAVRAGLSSPAVYFNIGVAAYRAGDYARADRAFKEVARTPAMAALAHYNLGLVAQRRNDLADARRWFALAERETADDQLRSLAQTQLAALPAVPDRNWFGYASLGAGYDDNVALVSSAAVLGISGLDDSFAEAQLAVGGPLSEPWRLDASLDYLDYSDLDEFDQLSLQAGARYRMSWSGWMGDFFGQLAYQTLDGAGFESRLMAGLRANHDLSSQWRVRAQYRFSDVDGMNAFSGITGQEHEASVRLARSGEPWDIAVEYRFETSDNDDAGLSATRHQLAFDASRNLNDKWLLSLDATLRYSRYDLAENGNEQLFDVAIAFARTLSDRWRLVLRYDFTHNDADRADFHYERNRIAAVVEAML